MRADRGSYLPGGTNRAHQGRRRAMAEEIFCGFGVDVDAVAGWLGSYGGEDSPDDISRGLFAGEVGSPRLLKLFARLGIKPTLAVNARVCDDYPRVAEQAKRAGWEFMGHSYQQGPIHQEPDQVAMIERSLSTIERFTGTRPIGWLGPGLTETFETPELLVAAGIKYIGDWVYDDEPTTIRTANGPLVTLPYSVELNDIPMMIVQHHEGEHLLKRAIDQFDRLYMEGRERAKILALAIHPYISGQPHRIKYLEAIYEYAARFEGVLHWNGLEILEWYQKTQR